MDHVAALEAQKERESAWVQDGADAFMARLKDTDPTMTPAGRGVIKRCSEKFRARLNAYVSDHSRTPRPMQSPTYQIIMALGVDHVAAVALHNACSWALCSTRRYHISDGTVVRIGQEIGSCLEADLRFRVWRKDAEGAEKRAVARMRERMKGDPKTWRSRARQLAALAEIEWTQEMLAIVGVDLLGMLAEANPDTFTARTARYGHKTFVVLDLTDEASKTLTLDTEAVAVARPRLGLMLVPPREWRYVEGQK